jgi:hypothetical protein
VGIFCPRNATTRKLSASHQLHPIRVSGDLIGCPLERQFQ